MDIGGLVTFLAPFMTYLLRVGEPAAEEAARKVGEDGWELAKSLWRKLQPSAEPRLLDAAADLAGEPDDEDYRAVLRVQLKKLLADDPALEQDLAAAYEQVKSAGVAVSGDRSVGVDGSVSGSTIVTGDHNTTNR